jgi:hypothetical protein
MTNVSKKTVMRLLVEVGEVCADYQNEVFRNLRCKRLQLDEMWAWIYCKEKHRTEEIAKAHPDAGDIWFPAGPSEDATREWQRILLTIWQADCGLESN